MVKISNKCGRIKGFVDRQAIIKVKGIKKDVKVPVAFLKAPKGFGSLSFSQMEAIINKKNMGYKKGQRACITNEFQLFS